MGPEELTNAEHLALVGLLRQLAVGDGDVSDAEAEALEELGIELGGERFLYAWRRAGEQLSTAQLALDFAADHVRRDEARTLVVTMLTDLELVEARSAAEQRLVNQVRLMWGLPLTR